VHHVGSVLLLCGLGLTVGNLVGARLADWRLMPSLAGIFLVLVAILACLALLDHGLSFAGIPWLAAVPALGALAVTIISIFQEQRTRQFDFAASQGSVQPG